MIAISEVWEEFDAWQYSKNTSAEEIQEQIFFDNRKWHKKDQRSRSLHMKAHRSFQQKFGHG